MNKKVLLRLLKPIRSQRFWELVYRTALYKMNFGNGGNLYSSGELWVANFIKSQLEGEKRVILFDVGANTGKYAIEMAKIFDENTSIYAFEPSKITFEKLKNSTAPFVQITAVNLGFGAEKKEEKLYFNKEGSSLASIYQRNLEHYGIAMDQSEEIRLDRLDDYCISQKISTVHFLKIDVEGHEMGVLQGAKHMLDRKLIHFIQFEFGGSHIDSRNYFQDFYFFLSPNYRIYRILADGLHEIKKYDEMHEIFMAINYLAIRK
ncbi:FkbM family methyltransferase [Marinilongibacter aquaticus]|uniref:FkbM family methyltransferase n=1 Tax=Marinilongibacter aquaticus TaxID=2975157 RepID=UPI0021BDBB3B|nr:FkbM family methyltransferase [Marinilongibacter aquaticus]UBM59250.1 FkbM family methyltransferase [Marinilongibacter aquaticus]